MWQENHVLITEIIKLTEQGKKEEAIKNQEELTGRFRQAREITFNLTDAQKLKFSKAKENMSEEMKRNFTFLLEYLLFQQLLSMYFYIL